MRRVTFLNKYFYIIIGLLFIYLLTKSKANKFIWWYGDKLSESYENLFKEG